ncbi:MAG: c-type cytochrome [Planctomycetaceae bacterium]|nr:c-type cytochrome [Planctomycetaceae bacterium]
MSRPVQALLSLIAISICGPLVSSARAEERPNVIATALPLEFIPQQIDVPEGFSIELVAGPPLVEHPTFATFDDHGKLYVCNNAGVNLSADDLEAQLPNSINLLEDTDGDGKFDKSTVFADKMTFPMGGVWHEGSLYVASPPNIWRLTDTTGDGIADKRDIIVDRFGFSGNGASIHGCFLGPDGRLYWCDGYHGHEFKDKDGNVTTSRKGSYIFSSTIAGTDVRRHSGGGMDNPVEVDFTPAGEVLGTVNIFYTRPRVDCLVHWLHGGAYPHREQVLEELQTTGPVLGPVHRFGHVAISGTLRYRSGALNPQWRDNMFATFFNSGKVVRVELERSGATYSAVQREFISSENREFHPTDLVEDADGSLIVVDTGGWFYRGCPTSQFARPDVLGAIYRVRRDGMTTPVDPRGNRIDWPAQTPAQLAQRLGDPRYTVRQRAILESAARGQAAITTLRQTIERRDILNQQGAIWALTNIVGKTIVAEEQSNQINQNTSTLQLAAQEAIRIALGDRNPLVQHVAVRSFSTYPDPLAKPQLIHLLKSEHPEIRREAATALGRLGDPTAIEHLLAALANPTDIDRTEDHAIIFALIEIDDAQVTRQGLVSDDPDSQRGALLALDQMTQATGGNLTSQDVLRLVNSPKTRTQLAAAHVFSQHADWAKHSVEVIGPLLKATGTLESREIARQLITDSLGQDGTDALVGRLLSNHQTPIEITELLLDAMTAGNGLTLPASWTEPLEKRLASDEQAIVDQTLTALAAIKTDHFDARLQQLGNDTTRPMLQRIAALEVANGQRGRITDDSLELLLQLIHKGSGAGLGAAQRIGSTALTTAQLKRIVTVFPSARAAHLTELIRPYERSSDPEIAKLFVNSIATAQNVTGVPPFLFGNVIKRFPQDLLPAANDILGRIRIAEQAKLARLDKLLPLIGTGDVSLGKKIFFAEKSKCAACHRVGERGSRIGPDLTTIGANRAGHDLLESIVLPSSTIVRDFEPYNIVTNDGRVLTGLIVRQTVDSFTIQQQTGDPITLARNDIDEMAAGTVSIMPNGLDKALTESELADVIAYLMSLRKLSNNEAAAQ